MCGSIGVKNFLRGVKNFWSKECWEGLSSSISIERKWNQSCLRSVEIRWKRNTYITFDFLFISKSFEFFLIFPPWRSKSKKIPRVFTPKSLWNHGEMILYIQGYSPNSGHTYLWLELNFLFSLEVEPFSRTHHSHYHFHKTNPKIYLIYRCQDKLSSFPT